MKKMLEGIYRKKNDYKPIELQPSNLVIEMENEKEHTSSRNDEESNLINYKSEIHPQEEEEKSNKNIDTYIVIYFLLIVILIQFVIILFLYTELKKKNIEKEQTNSVSVNSDNYNHININDNNKDYDNNNDYNNENYNDDFYNGYYKYHNMSEYYKEYDDYNDYEESDDYWYNKEYFQNETEVDEYAFEDNNTYPNLTEIYGNYENFTNKFTLYPPNTIIKLNPKNIPKNKLNKYVIPIALSADNNYVAPLIVVMTSIIKNKSPTTFLYFIILIPPDFSRKNKSKLKENFLLYRDLDIIFIDMKDSFKNAKAKSYSRNVYYRLSLYKIFPFFDKIIWLDGDTLVFQDLKEMYENPQIDNFYYMGAADSLSLLMEKRFGIGNATYICSGVLLINTKKIREINSEERIKKFIWDYQDKTYNHDQDIINYCYTEGIGVLPIKFGIFGFESAEFANKHNKKLAEKNKLKENEIINAYENPGVMHMIWPKPWWKEKGFRCPKYDEWWHYARISKQYNFINKFSLSTKE